MHTLGDALSELELRKEILVEVEQYRLARQATGRELGWQVRVLGELLVCGFQRAMAGLGCLLVGCGSRLQQRFMIEPGRAAD